MFQAKSQPFARKLRPIADIVYACAPHVVDQEAIAVRAAPPTLPAVTATAASTPASTGTGATPASPVAVTPAAATEDANDDDGNVGDNAAAGSSSSSTPVPEKVKADPRTWWYTEFSAADRARPDDVFAELPRHYRGWPDSRRYLSQLWATEGPFDVICGFSQGAVAVHQLLCELEAALHHGVTDALPADDCAAILASPPSAAILVCGFPSRSDRALLPLGAKLRTPSLHVNSESDATVNIRWQRELLNRFHSPDVILHDKGHSMPQRSGDMAVVVGFVSRHIRSGSSRSTTVHRGQRSAAAPGRISSSDESGGDPQHAPVQASSESPAVPTSGRRP